MKGYGSDDIGELDDEELNFEEGVGLKTKFVDNILNEFLVSQRRGIKISEEMKDADYKEKIKLSYFNQDSNSDDEKDFESHVYFQQNEKEKWDCESILSTLSTTENRPKIISLQSLQKKTKKKATSDSSNENNQSDKPIIKLSKKTGLPLGVLGTVKEIEPNIIETSGPNKGISRKRNETKEEKKGEKRIGEGRKKAKSNEKERDKNYI